MGERSHGGGKVSRVSLCGIGKWGVPLVQGMHRRCQSSRWNTRRRWDLRVRVDQSGAGQRCRRTTRHVVSSRAPIRSFFPSTVRTRERSTAPLRAGFGRTLPCRVSSLFLRRCRTMLLLLLPRRGHSLSSSTPTSRQSPLGGAILFGPFPTAASRSLSMTTVYLFGMPAGLDLTHTTVSFVWTRHHHSSAIPTPSTTITAASHHSPIHFGRRVSLVQLMVVIVRDFFFLNCTGQVPAIETAHDTTLGKSIPFAH